MWGSCSHRAASPTRCEGGPSHAKRHTQSPRQTQVPFVCQHPQAPHTLNSTPYSRHAPDKPGTRPHTYHPPYLSTHHVHTNTHTCNYAHTTHTTYTLLHTHAHHPHSIHIHATTHVCTHLITHTAHSSHMHHTHYAHIPTPTPHVPRIHLTTHPTMHTPATQTPCKNHTSTHITSTPNYYTHFTFRSCAPHMQHIHTQACSWVTFPLSKAWITALGGGPGLLQAGARRRFGDWRLSGQERLCTGPEAGPRGSACVGEGARPGAVAPRHPGSVYVGNGRRAWREAVCV